MNKPDFWKQKKLHELNDKEWEAVCDGCGRCCLHKLEDIDSGELHYTRLACKLLDIDTCQCKNYADRFSYVPDCISLKQDLYQTLKWLPASCAYRLLAEGKDLPDWHHLVSGDPLSVETAGISIKHFAVCEDEDKDPHCFIIDDL
jgi:uncharacterized cysteine cluster protein YcgN (CxxCxxCC family)